MLFLARDGMKGQLVDLESQTVVRNYALGEVARNAVVYSPANQSVIAHQSRNCALFLSAATQQPLQRSFTPELVTSCAVTRCGTFMVAGTANGTVLVWSLLSGELIKNFRAHLRAIQCVALSSDDSLVATASEDSVCKVWALSTLVSLRMREAVPRSVFTGHSLGVNCCVFLRHANVLLTGSSDRTCRLVDTQTGEQLHAITVGDAVTAVTVSSDDSAFVAGTHKGFLYFADLYTASHGLPVAGGGGSSSSREALLRPPSADGHHSPLVFLECDPAKPSLVLTASAGGAVLWYDLRSGRLVRECVGSQKGTLFGCCLVPSTALHVKGACAALEKNPIDPSKGNYHVTQHVVALRSTTRGEKRGRDGQGSTLSSRESAEKAAALQALLAKTEELHGLRARLQRQLQKLTSQPQAQRAEKK